MVDKRQNVLEKLIIEEAIGEFMDLLTDRQRQVIHQIYFQQRTQRELQNRQYQNVFHRQSRK